MERYAQSSEQTELSFGQATCRADILQKPGRKYDRLYLEKYVMKQPEFENLLLEVFGK